MSIAQQVLAALAEVAEIEDVKRVLDIRLFDEHILDSLKTVEFILLLSDRLGLDISPAEIDREKWATPAKIVEYFEARVSS
jgi:D-alanine--poly(phosphoribitol) ligase subunit 2